MALNILYGNPYLGKIPILTNIFQRGWFNHQLVELNPKQLDTFGETYMKKTVEGSDILHPPAEVGS